MLERQEQVTSSGISEQFQRAFNHLISNNVQTEETPLTATVRDLHSQIREGGIAFRTSKCYMDWIADFQNNMTISGNRDVDTK